MDKIKTFFRSECSFFKNSLVWPSKQECIHKTAVVVVVVTGMAAMLIAADALIGFTMSIIV